MKTMKQIADELGVDKQRVYRFVRQNHIDAVQGEALPRNGVKYFDKAAEDAIKRGLTAQKAPNTASKVSEPIPDDAGTSSRDVLLEALQKELEMKNEQIKELNNRLAEANATLRVAQKTACAAQRTARAAQMLYAGTIQRQLLTEGRQMHSKAKPKWFQRLFRR